MERKWRISIILGFIAFAFSFVFSLMNNTWQTSMFRAGIGFILFAVLSFLVLVVLDQLVSSKESESIENEIQETKVEPHTKEQLEDEDFQSLPLSSLHKGDHQEL